MVGLIGAVVVSGLLAVSAVASPAALADGAPTIPLTAAWALLAAGSSAVVWRVLGRR